jgi:predicted ATPase
VTPKASGEIVGREAELETAFSFLESVSDGPNALLIEGEAGIGKTSIWSRCLDEARERGFRLLVTRAAEAETRLGFTALVDLLEDVADDALDELPRPQRRALEVALLRREATKGRADPRAVSTATLGVLRRLATARPLLIAVDDLQWVDSASDRVIRFVLRRLDLEQIGFIATRRVEGGRLCTHVRPGTANGTGRAHSGRAAEPRRNGVRSAGSRSSALSAHAAQAVQDLGR